MTPHEVELQRAAYQVAYQNGYRHGALDAESMQRLPEMLLRQEAETEAIATYPLPPAKVWRCKSCGKEVQGVYWHMPGGTWAHASGPGGSPCGPVEEVTP